MTMIMVMAMRMLMVMSLRVVVIMRMPVVMSMRMTMVVVMVPTHGKHPEQIDTQAQRADQQQLTCNHLRRIEDSLNSFENDEDGNEKKEDPVREPR